MEQVFIRILNMSMTGSIIIAAVLAARLMLRRAPKLYSYLLWAVVLIRLLCPVSFSSAFSLLGALRAPAPADGELVYIPPDIGMMQQPAVDLPLLGTDNPVSSSLPAASPAASANPMQILLFFGSYLWLAGVLVLAICGVVSYLFFRKKMRTILNADSTKSIHHDNQEGISSLLPWQRTVQICESPALTTAFVCGILRPRIYLPSALDADERAYVLLHEQMHLRRGDHIFRLAGFAALCLHWFNPLVWLACWLSGRDMEMSCDEAVIRQSGVDIKKQYSASLLSMATGQRLLLPGTPLAFAESDTGSRIRNVLRYRRPAKAAAILLVTLCLLLGVLLLANPVSRAGDSASDIVDTGQDTFGDGMPAADQGEPGEVWYGIVSADGPVLIIPGYGSVAIPEADEISPYIEFDFAGLEAGQLARITFPAGEHVLIREGNPGQFTGTAESIHIMGLGFSLLPLENGRYLFTVPIGMARDAAAGDTLEIWHHDPDIDGMDAELLVTTPVLSVDASNYDIWIELSADDAQTFLSEFGFGIRCELLRQAEEITGALPLTGELIADGIPDDTYQVTVRSLSRSAMGIDRYAIAEPADPDMELPFLAFSKDCICLVNRSMDHLQYEEASFEEFAARTEEACAVSEASMLLTFTDGQITRAVLEDYYGYGITFDAAWMFPYDVTADIRDFSAGYATVTELQADIAMSPGDETIEVSVGTADDIDSGVVRFLAADGSLLTSVYTEASREYWTNLYLGGRDGTDFLLQVRIDDLDAEGSYSYHVFRLTEGGNLMQIAGSSFRYGDGIAYDDAVFQTWADTLAGWLADSRLIISTQGSVLRTERVSDAERYCYETLRR